MNTALKERMENRHERRAKRAILRGVRLDSTAGIADVQAAIKQMHDSLQKRDVEMTNAVAKANDDIKNLGKISEDTKALINKQAEGGIEIQNRLVALEQKIVQFKPANDQKIITPGTQFIEDAGVKAYFGDGKGPVKRGRISAPVNAITSLSSGSGGVGDMIQPQRLPGIIEMPTRKLTVRDLLPVGQTTSNAIEYIQETGFTNAARPVAEGTEKPESTIEVTIQTAPVRTIAHLMYASVQVLADIPMLRSYIDTRLRIGLRIEEEDQILAGDGTGQNLLGLIPQATDYDSARNQPGDTRIDIIRRGMTQLELAIYRATAVVMHPRDWEEIELTKNTQGDYIWANPRGLLNPTIWGLPVVTSTALQEGEFLLGAFDVAAQIWDRQQATVEVSSEDGDNFKKNMVTLRGEERIALTVYRPESFIFGDFDDVVSS